MTSADCRSTTIIGTNTVGPRSGESSAHVHGGPPVLDIGGNIGACSSTMEPDAAEAPNCTCDQSTEPPINIHTGVWHDRSNGSATTAVFAELVEGSYWVLDSSGTDLRQVEIRGGALTSIDLRD